MPTTPPPSQQYSRQIRLLTGLSRIFRAFAIDSWRRAPSTESRVAWTLGHKGAPMTAVTVYNVLMGSESAQSGDTVLGIGTGTSSSSASRLPSPAFRSSLTRRTVTEVIYLNKALALLDTGVSASDRRLVVMLTPPTPTYYVICASNPVALLADRCALVLTHISFSRLPFSRAVTFLMLTRSCSPLRATQIVTLVVGFILIYFESTILQLSKIDQTELTVLDGRWTILLRDTEGPVCRVLRYLSTSKPASARTTPMVLG
ncbi:uncharacterized protein B0H18DRAFT_1127046 [Fomitopsis serialis]|uniref:uncharacterized protein n=1 Tax=Fomitopsis serialis TaxID=139415 RepID=UPI002007E77C|nr:uncharacterized protein B0H18DRAFT_1127046 [Neoantrodia serialis]KAH9912564.1 hypothetical protein B0H18DRAFT_1127046 [Neoantrodia serialis]